MEPSDRSLLARLRALLAGDRLAVPAPGPSGLTAPDPAAAPEGRGTRWEEVLRVQAVTVNLLTRKATPAQLFRHVVEGAADALGADEASLMLLEGDELQVVAATGAGREGPGPRREPIRLGEGVAGLVARTGSPVLLNEGDDLSRFPNLVPKGGRIQSAVSVPLEVGGRVVGVLNANRLAGGERFTEGDVAVLRLFAGTAALAIDQTSVLQRAQARSRSLEALLSVTEAFAGAEEPAAALAAVLPRLAATYQPALLVAFLGAGDPARLPAVAAWTPARGLLSAERLDGAALDVGADARQALEAREPAWPPELRVTPGLADAGALPSRLLLVPIATGPGPARGAIVLGWDEPGFVLSQEELRVLDGLARQMALALSREDRASLVGALEAEVAQARVHLVEMERLATIGQSMAGLVHDINAPLTALMTLAQMVQHETGELSTRERTGQIIHAAQRAQRLVRELLTMARPQPPTFEPVDLHVLLRSAMDLERPQCAVSGIRLTADFAPDVPSLTADPHRLGQVFMNLLVNARQAMDAAEKGTAIGVRTRRRDGTVEVRVADDGPGIPPAARAKVFDWFFTTKPPGEGTGLGLAVSRDILLAHGGNLRVEDTPGGGATFVIELPVERPAS